MSSKQGQVSTAEMTTDLADSQDHPATPGGRLRWARNNARLSGLDVAGQLGMSRQALSQMERDEIDIPEGKIYQLADMLGTTPQWLRRGRGAGPAWPELPVMVPELNLEGKDLDLQRLGADDAAWARYRTQRAWALPASEAQRLGVCDRDKLIAIRVRRAIPPEFRRGDIVMLDCAVSSFCDDNYYGIIFDDVFKLAALKAGDFGTLLMLQRKRRPRSISVNDVKILGSVFFSFRPRDNFTF